MLWRSSYKRTSIIIICVIRLLSAPLTPSCSTHVYPDPLYPLLIPMSVCFITLGTPATNRPVELFTQLNGLLPHVFSDYEQFTKRWRKDSLSCSLVEQHYDEINLCFLVGHPTLHHIDSHFFTHLSCTFLALFDYFLLFHPLSTDLPIIPLVTCST